VASICFFDGFGRLKKMGEKKIGGSKDEPNSDHGSSWPHQNNADHHEPSSKWHEPSMKQVKISTDQLEPKKLTKKSQQNPSPFIMPTTFSHFHQHSSENH
jgi:hypothetical protein